MSHVGLAQLLKGTIEPTVVVRQTSMWVHLPLATSA
jgi:hypothetical protein